AKGSGQVFGHLDFKLIVEPTDAPPFTVVLLAPSRQEKAAWTSDISQCIDNIRCNGLMTIVFEENSKVTVPHMIKSDARLHRDDIDICFSKTLNSCKVPQIRYASVERLLERLTDLRFLSIDFLNTFLHTYRIFTTAAVVLEKLSDIYRQLADVIVRILSIFEQSWKSGEVPVEWKVVNIVPVFKKCRKGTTGNYRPISLTSVPVRSWRKLSGKAGSGWRSGKGSSPRGCWHCPGSPGNGHGPEAARASGAFGRCCQGCTGGSVGVSVQGQGLDSMILVGPFQLSISSAVLESVSVDRTIPESTSVVDTAELSPCRSPSTPRHLRYRQPGVQTADSSHCSVSPASAFAIATAAAGHGSPPG
ncbi:RGRF2 factor, partial [Donacobius atricapilla]|nr:RGRF2 factor [Donacobius atricapilla]